MRLRHLTLKGYRCFKEARLTFQDLTALVGANGAGKTAAMQALVKLFGQGRAAELTRLDFHSEPGSTATKLSLSIEAVFDFPEVAEDGEEEVKRAVPPLFHQMTVEEVGAPPILRLRLSATWTQGNIPGGTVESRLEFIRHPLAVPLEDETATQPAKAQVRSLIHVVYVPAMRDPTRQLRQQAGSALWRLLHAIRWSDGLSGTLETQAEAISTAFERETGLSTVQQALLQQWRRFHAESTYSHLNLNMVSSELDHYLKAVNLVFRPTPGHEAHTSDQLGDGLRSLLYLTLICTTLEIEQGLQAENAEARGLDAEGAPMPPALTLLVVEEPENHLAPHLLGRTVGNLQRTAEQHNAQVVLSSHTPSLLRRVEPSAVRHLRLDRRTHSTVVSELTLPEETDAAFKFVSEAVRAYPELYFSRFVVFGEGASEELVLPRLLESRIRATVDEAFVSVVPLGGRHVNHFWRLLEQLKIPYVTLLDLDTGRSHGGIGQVRYAAKQLRIHRGAPLRVEGGEAEITEQDLETLGDSSEWEPWLRPTSTVLSPGPTSTRNPKTPRATRRRSGAES